MRHGKSKPSNAKDINYMSKWLKGSNYGGRKSYMADFIVDRSLDCCSIMKKMKIGEYLDLVQKAYDNRGGIQGQF